jgi:hypothetical protein
VRKRDRARVGAGREISESSNEPFLTCVLTTGNVDDSVPAVCGVQGGKAGGGQGQHIAPFAQP